MWITPEQIKSAWAHPEKSLTRFRFGCRFTIVWKKLCEISHVNAIDEKVLSKIITATTRVSFIA